jgi:prepilin-type N-terminal cleavage/methylation domain-containing protein
MTRRVHAQDGFTLVEILMAVTLMSFGIAATLSVFGGSDRTVLAAQRASIASQQGQEELDRLSKTAYSKLGLTAMPSSSTDPLNPGSRVSGMTFRVRTDLTEDFVLSTDAGQSAAAVSPAPTSFSVGVSGATVTGKIYRYVTWRNENCATGICDGSQNTKRVTVAVTVDAIGSLPARTAAFLSQVIPDPNAIAPGNSLPPPLAGDSTTTAQDFYLYDTRCGFDTLQAQSGSHATHNTASWGPPAPVYSVCENTTASGDATLQPDLMGPTKPSGDSSTPLYTYSSELTGSYSGGLAMKPEGAACRSNYTVSDDVWGVHAWSTPKFTAPFTLDGPVTVSIFTTTVAAAVGRGFVCATLLDRTVSGGVPTDTALGSTTYDLDAWPTDIRRISFSFDIDSATIPADHRLVLALSVRSESEQDLVFLYDHPTYPSFFEVATTTPL